MILTQCNSFLCKPRNERRTMKGKQRVEGKGICYASQNFTFDGIFIFLAQLIFKVTSGHPETANGRSLRSNCSLVLGSLHPIKRSALSLLAFHLQRIRRGVQIVGYNKPLFFAPQRKKRHFCCRRPINLLQRDFGSGAI